jgi:hypothetical protein
MKKQSLILSLCLISAMAIVSCSTNEPSVPQATSATVPAKSSTVVNEPAKEEPHFIQKAEVISEVGNLREDKNLKARILTVLPQYTWVEVIKTEKKWLYVKTLRGELGWLNRDSTRMLQPISNDSYYPTGGKTGSQTGYSASGPDDVPNGRELYDEVQRLKSREGLTDREAVRKILREMGEIH